MKSDISEVHLCVLVSTDMSPVPFETLVAEVVAGGAECVQLREKGISDARLLDLAKTCRDICRDTLFIVNDRADIALLAGADGVHVGQGDIGGRAARRIVGEDAIVGISTSNASELEAAVEEGPDYLGVGAVFATTTKETGVAGLEYVRQAARLTQLPFMAIGGIRLENVAEVVASGARAVAVCSGITASDDPRGATRAMREAILAALS